MLNTIIILPIWSEFLQESFYLCAQVYSDTHIDVFDTLSGDWVQTINIRKTRPLFKTGQLNLSMLQELPHITYLSNVNKG